MAGIGGFDRVQGQEAQRVGEPGVAWTGICCSSVGHGLRPGCKKAANHAIVGEAPSTRLSVMQLRPAAMAGAGKIPPATAGTRASCDSM
jgi:hypothetical protein